MSRKYGKWIGKPNGVPEDPERCVEEIQPEGLRHTVQCPNPRGHSLSILEKRDGDWQIFRDANTMTTVSE